jgi:hypothetical protein
MCEIALAPPLNPVRKCNFAQVRAGLASIEGGREYRIRRRRKAPRSALKAEHRGQRSERNPVASHSSQHPHPVPEVHHGKHRRNENRVTPRTRE